MLSQVPAAPAHLTRALYRHVTAVGAGRGLCIALALGLLLGSAGRLFPLWTQTTWLLILLALIPSGALLGALGGWWHARPLTRRLRRLDRDLGLADRLTTAYELRNGRISAPTSIIAAQWEETQHALAGIDPRAAFPPTPERRALWGAATLLGLLLPLLWFPNPQEAALARRAALQQAAIAEMQQLEQTIAQLETSEALDPDAHEAALAALREALETLSDPHATLEEQQLALAEAERQLAALRTPEVASQVRDLATAAPLSAEAVVQPFAEALARNDPEAAAEYLRDLLSPEGDPLTPEELLALADALAQMSEALRTSDPELAAQLEATAQSIYTGDSQQAQEALEAIAESLETLTDAAKSEQTLEAMQAQLQEARARLAAAQGGQPSAGNMTGGAMDGGQQGISQHSEDSGTGAPYGDEIAERIEESSGYITLPREQRLGEPQQVVGAPGNAQTPYREAYADYTRTAEAELTRRALPPGLRSYVRTYFSELEP